MKSRSQRAGRKTQGVDVKQLQDNLRALGYKFDDQNYILDQNTTAAVREFQAEHGLEETGMVDQETAMRINDDLQLTSANRFLIRGLARNADGRPAIAVQVRAYDCDMRSKEFLGEAITNENGEFQIEYSSEQFQRAEKRTADLQLSVSNVDGRVLAESPVIFNSKRVETIRLSIGSDILGSPSEFDQFTGELLLLTQGISFADLKEDIEHRDITFLSSETDINPQHISFLIIAHQLSESTKIRPEAFYGLFRENCPRQIHLLITQPEQIHREAFLRAFQKNIVPASLKNDLEEIIRALHSLNIEYPAFLIQPKIMFNRTGELNNLAPEQQSFIRRKLNEILQQHILGEIKISDEQFLRRIRALTLKTDFLEFQESDIATVIKEGILPELKREEHFAKLAFEVEQSLTERFSPRVKDILQLDTPVRENPAFRTEVHNAISLEYAKLVNLESASAIKIIQKGILLQHAEESTLADLVSEGILKPQQASELSFIINLGKLTYDNISLISALKSSDLGSVESLIAWSADHWKKVITELKVPLPLGETQESYADKILFNLERTYPSEFLLHRIVQAPTFDLKPLEVLNQFLESNERLVNGSRPAQINWGTTDPEKIKSLQQDLIKLTSLSNAHRHLGLSEIINNNALAIDEKKNAIQNRLKLMSTFYQNNPKLDLRTANLFHGKESSFNWTEIPLEDRVPIRKQLMAYQRVLTLADDTSDREVLLDKGFDSAIEIASLPEADFLKLSGLPLGKAKMTYAKAQESIVSVSNSYAAMQDAMSGKFSDLAVSNLFPKVINDLKEIDGFDDLFGPQDFCNCEECRSILSPAAYFIDLMYFIEQNVSEPVFINPNKGNHPLYLKKRRGDLWKLKLTCENTHTLIPYLIIVNEVLENYVEGFIAGDIFETLSQSNQKISFRVPFNLSLEELRLYLSHFSVAIHDVYRLLKKTDEKVWRARLSLSNEEFGVITLPDPSGVKFRFGNPSSFAGFDLQTFLRSAGITRAQLDELLALKFNPDMNSIKVGKKSNPDELQNFTEILNNLSNIRLDFIHRFLRLLRKSPWNIKDLDLILSNLKEAGAIGGELNATLILTIAQLIDIQEMLKLSVEELCTMFHQMPVSETFPKPPLKKADVRLYERIFDLKKLFGEKDSQTHELNVSATFHHYSLNTLDPNDKEIDPKTPILLGGLGITETELLLLFDLLKDSMPFDAHGDTTLDRKRISLLYRHARIAKALRLNIEDFIQALHLNFGPQQVVISSLDQIPSLKAFRDWIKKSPFSVSELRFIIKGEESTLVKYKNNLETVSQLIQTVQASPDPDKIKTFLSEISKMFNVTSGNLSNLLKWANTDVNSPGISIALNATFTDGVADDPSALNPVIELLKEIERTLSIFTNLKLKEDSVTYLTEKHAVLGIAELKKISLKNVIALTFYRVLIRLLEDGEPLVQSILDNYFATGSFSTKDKAGMADLWSVDQSLIESLSNSLTLSTVPIEALTYLSEALTLCQILGINGYSLQKLGEDQNFAAITAARDVALGAFSSKYEDEKTRQEKLEPYQDKINVLKRDALTDYIIAHQKDLKFKDLKDIYAFFLLDVEMSGCFRTSRVVCGISSLQLYIHRCLVNLEQSSPKLNPNISDIKVDPTLIPSEEWEWRKNYRVWEANRKVFLHPEHYILPELLDIKSSIFKELEDELLQEKLTKDNAEAAYKKYLSQFAELTRLKIAGSYYHNETKTYYLFGHTQQDPPTHYYRKWIDTKRWTAWEKIELGINSDHVSAIIYTGKLFLFWIEIKETSKTKVVDAGSIEINLKHKDLVYSFLTEQGKWISPQKIRLGTWLDPVGYVGEYDENLAYMMIVDPSQPNSTAIFAKPAFKNLNTIVFPVITNDHEIALFLYDWFCTFFDYDSNTNKNEFQLLSWKLDLFANKVVENKTINGLEIIPADWPMLKLKHFLFQAALEVYQTSNDIHEAEQENELLDTSLQLGPLVTSSYSDTVFHSKLDLVSHRPGDFTFKHGSQQFLIYRPHPGGGGYKNLVPAITKRVTRRISTSLADELGKILFSEQLDGLFSLKTQKLTEHPIEIKFTKPAQLLGPYDDPGHIDFRGAYGIYYREIFFYIPFLIANQLNANQKYQESKWWYERMFNPTASESPDDKKPTDRNWRYIEFRNLTTEKLKDILTDEDAIEQYKKDPFNPHAIARLRLSSYQKAIVMKYIDNLLDWGDYLFGQDTMESINEATMLYVLAADILGRRPVELGKCETVKEEKVTYEELGPAIKKGSEFLIMLENWSYSNSIFLEFSKNKFAENKYKAIGANILPPSEDDNSGDLTTTSLIEAFAEMQTQHSHNLYPYKEVADTKADYMKAVKAMENASVPKYPGITQIKQSILAFCIPPNYELLKYWDRVEDRLYKIRHCMNISGIRRQLALFQPPIEPMALVRGRAAGLGLEEILAAAAAPLPHYRFIFLIEKAKQFSQTVQNFGNALLSALERKDVEELTLLKSVHEKQIQRMSTQIKKQQVKEAQHQYANLLENQKNVNNRITFYQGLLDSGLTGWEIAQQGTRHAATALRVAASAVHLQAAMTYLVPQAGSPFAMKYGGKELGDSGVEFAQWTSSMAEILEAASASTGMEATFQRRDEDWLQQLVLAQQELKQVDQQILAAEARQVIAEKDLEVHEQNMEQTDEVHEFYKNKFTNLALGNYLCTTLNRLYREAYNIAYDLAKMAEHTYQFERDDETIFIASDNWQLDSAGLLAGERLLLQLQQLEKAYMDTNSRDYEITQSFSVALFDPSKMVELRQNAKCEFTIPELAYDLVYPGQFRRFIKSLRITMPCVAGPYVNIGAKLTLKESKVRRSPTTESSDLVDVQNQKNKSVAFSTAVNDGGQFELNFRDERFLPFEGAGAISTWILELPSTLRTFDYETISDVILHISYSAKDDGAFKETVENQISDSLMEYASSIGLYRLVSIRHDFPNAFHQLLNPVGTIQTASFEISKQHFPYFLIDQELTLSGVKVYLRPKGKDAIETSGLNLEVNNVSAGSWTDFGKNLKESLLSISGSPIKTWTVNAGEAGLDKEELADIFLLLKYGVF